MDMAFLWNGLDAMLKMCKISYEILNAERVLNEINKRLTCSFTILPSRMPHLNKMMALAVCWCLRRSRAIGRGRFFVHYYFFYAMKAYLFWHIHCSLPSE